MNVKKYFCCVPIINVRQSVTVSHDKSTQHNGVVEGTDEGGKHEVYKNITFKEEQDLVKDPELSQYPNRDFRRGSGLSQASTISNGKPKSLCFTDIAIGHDNNSTGSSNHSVIGRLKVGYKFSIRRI